MTFEPVNNTIQADLARIGIEMEGLKEKINLFAARFPQILSLRKLEERSVFQTTLAAYSRIWREVRSLPDAPIEPSLFDLVRLKIVKDGPCLGWNGCFLQNIPNCLAGKSSSWYSQGEFWYILKQSDHPPTAAMELVTCMALAQTIRATHALEAAGSSKNQRREMPRGWRVVEGDSTTSSQTSAGSRLTGFPRRVDFSISGLDPPTS